MWQQMLMISFLVTSLLNPWTLAAPAASNGYTLMCSGLTNACYVTGHELIEEDQLNEGDIIVDEEDKLDLEEDRNAIIDAKKKWPNAIVPYIFHIDFLNESKELIINEMEFIQSQTCIKFVEYETTMESNYVLITKAKGCHSSVGYDEKARRILNLSPRECLWKRGKIHHEMLHVLGLKHEHSRPDRDDHVVIITENIQPGRAYDFIKANPLEFTTFGLPYDYRSVMHYRSTAFSKDGISPTIMPTESGTAPIVLGQRVSATDQDLEKVIKMYNCPPNVATTPPEDENQI